MAAITISRVSGLSSEAQAIDSITGAYFRGSVDEFAFNTALASARLMRDRATLDHAWRSRVLDPTLAVNSMELTRTAKPVMAALTKFGDGAVDLATLPADSVNGMHLAMVLRVTWTRRERTRGWKEALATARVALANQGVNPNEALLGMISAE